MSQKLLRYFRFYLTRNVYESSALKPCAYKQHLAKKYSTNQKPTQKQLITIHGFQEIANKNKESYLEMVNIYKGREKFRRGHVEFIYAALKYMKEFGVEKDLEVYKSLIDVFPKGIMIPRNMFQVEFMHYPKQQQCAIDLLEQMEENGVIPDWNMEDQLVNVFGKKGYPVRRYWRMMYWMPKFKNLSPWPLPDPIPNDTYELTKLAIERITSVDINTEITTFKSSEVKDSIDDTWIISGQSRDQRDLLENLPPKTPVYVEGGFRIWLRNKSVTYFILRADPDLKESESANENIDDVGNLKVPLFSKVSSLPTRKKTVHEQSDGAILGVCASGTSSRDSLLSWIRLLQKTNPHILNLTVLFPMKSPIGEVLPVQELEDNSEKVKILDGGTDDRIS